MRYDECLKFILKAEGGYVNDPTDRGGATNKGITQRTYNAWLTARQLPLQSVADITDDDVSDIYKDNYWVELPRLLDLCVFDAAVQHGRSKAIKFLQQVVGSPSDGVCGKNTLYAVNTYILSHGIKELLEAYLRLRRAFYKAIVVNDPTQQHFARGWENRVVHLEGVLYGV